MTRDSVATTVTLGSELSRSTCVPAQRERLALAEAEGQQYRRERAEPVLLGGVEHGLGMLGGQHVVGLGAVVASRASRDGCHVAMDDAVPLCDRERGSEDAVRQFGRVGREPSLT